MLACTTYCRFASKKAVNKINGLEDQKKQNIRYTDQMKASFLF